MALWCTHKMKTFEACNIKNQSRLSRSLNLTGKAWTLRFYSQFLFLPPGDRFAHDEAARVYSSNCRLGDPGSLSFTGIPWKESKQTERGTVEGWEESPTETHFETILFSSDLNTVFVNAKSQQKCMYCSVYNCYFVIISLYNIVVIKGMAFLK